MYVYNLINFYLVSFYYSITEIILVSSMLFLPIHIALTCLLFSLWSRRNFTSTSKVLAKPLFCATLQSFALVGMIASNIGRSLQGFGPFSVPVVVDSTQCILIIIFSLIYSRINLNTLVSWLCGILLFVFSIPQLGNTFLVLGIYLFDVNSFTLLGLFVVPMLFILLLPGIQLASIALTQKNSSLFPEEKMSYFKLFAALIISNIVGLVVVKYIVRALRPYSRMLG